MALLACPMLLHLVCGNAVRQLGHAAGISGAGGGRCPVSSEQTRVEWGSGSEPRR